MRYSAAKYLIAALGLFGVSLAAPDRIKRQISDNDRANRLYNEFLNPGVNISSSTHMNTAVEILPSCLCVYYLRCTKNRTSGSHKIIIDERFSEMCLNNLDVCCPTSHILSENETTTPVLNPSRQGCGFRNPDGVGLRIISEHDMVQFGEFPWMVVVLKKIVPDIPGVYKCGGSLIRPQVVLTAAHNVKEYVGRPRDLRVRAGDWDVKTVQEPIPHQEREVEAVILHENFDADNLNNDFALLILETVFETSPSVNTICLPQKTDIFDAERCIATGWGKDAFGSQGRFQAVLKKIELPVVPREPCEASLRLTRLSDTFNLDQSFICAGGEPGNDTCTGDGGSPLVCPLRNDPDRYVQAGIVSWGIGCGEDRVPGVYGSVAMARQWIDRKMILYDLD